MACNPVVSRYKDAISRKKNAKAPVATARRMLAIKVPQIVTKDLSLYFIGGVSSLTSSSGLMNEAIDPELARIC